MSAAPPGAPTDARSLLASTPLLVRRGPYALGAWPPTQDSALAQALLAARRQARSLAHADVLLFCIDELEVTALLREDRLALLPPPRSVERGWSILTPDIVLAWNVTGVLAALSGALAAAEIPIGAVTAFSRDHLLVPSARLDAALAALSGLCGEVRTVD